MHNWYVESALVVVCFMHLLFFLAVWTRDNSWADVGWGLGFAVLSIWAHLKSPHPGSALLALLTCIWGVRLAAHLLLRKLKNPGEDWRYARWRKAWGKNVLFRSYFQVFLLQGTFMWIIALPLWLRPGGETGHWVQWVGVLVWAIGFLWETIADWQLARFKAISGNRGKLLCSGLWRYSRHPNYFGEIVLWWGIFLLVLPWQMGYLCLVSPIIVTWLLAWVSGVPMLEGKYRDNPEYHAYVRTTPALFPFIHRSGR